jgi:hypothetical protein
MSVSTVLDVVLCLKHALNADTGSSEALPASVFGETDYLKSVPLGTLEIANI